MKKIEKYEIIAFIVMTMLLICFLMSSGTHDMDMWEKWMGYVDQYGIIEGYKMQHDMYPPFALLVQYFAKYIFPFLSNFAVLRLTNTFFVLISILLIHLLYRNLKITFFTFCCLLVSSNLGYLDVGMIPFLILAIYFFSKENFYYSGLFFAILSLIKYQPLIIAPFFFIYFITIYDFQQQKHRLSIDIKKLFQISIPIIIIWAMVCIIYRGEPLNALEGALFKGGSAISPRGLNLGWIMQFLLERFRPDMFGTLNNGAIMIIYDAPDKWLSFKYIFFVFYFIVVCFWTLHREKKSQLALRYAVIGYTIYFLFNSGVHENHLFLAMFLMVLLYAQEPTKINQNRTIMYIFIFNINLVEFYGISGSYSNRVIDGFFDPSLMLACFNVIYLTITCFHMLCETVHISIRQ